jgi:hypothetical protein
MLAIIICAICSPHSNNVLGKIRLVQNVLNTVRQEKIISDRIKLSQGSVERLLGQEQRHQNL